MTFWTEISEERYMEALEVLPPAVMTGAGFLLGEPETHRMCTVSKFLRPVYSAYVEKAGKFYAGPAMTIPEFYHVKREEVA